MKVVCDNCDAVYKIPDEKLTKPVNKATCRSCGNRMLIPRPSGADPDERTLVNPKDEAEATLPAGKAPQTRQEAGLRPPGAARPGTPRPSPPRPSSSREPEQTTWEQQQAPAAYSTPAPVRRENAGSAAPAPMREGGYAQAAYDPAGDLTWAVLGTVGAMFGSFMLIADAHFSDIAYEAAYRFAAASITLGGVFTSMLVLILSGRGRQKPSLITALALGAILGLGAAFIGSATRVGAEAYFANEITFGQNEGSRGLAEVVMEPVAETAGAATEDGEDGGKDGEDGSADAEPVTAPASGPKPAPKPGAETAPRPTPAPAQPTVVTVPSPTPSPSPTSAPTPTPAPVAPAPAPVPRPAPEPVGDPNLPSQPAFETIDIMLKSNLEVKKCFYGLLKAEGALPSRVEVRLSIYPSGDVKSVGVKDTRYAGTEFDACLARAVKNITFPPSNRGGTFTYPFILN